MGKVALPADVNHLEPRMKRLSLVLLVLQLGANGHGDLDNVDSDTSAVGLSKAPLLNWLEPKTGEAGEQIEISVTTGCI